jgi:Dyp-type peroxidase family
MVTPALNLGNIQGNSVGGFNKDFQSFLFLKFKSAAKGRAWLKEISDPDSDVSVAKSSSEEVLRFNAQFKDLLAQGVKPETVVAAAWTNVALSFQGLSALSVKAADLAKFPAAFRAGMAGRATAIGDVGLSAPANWIVPFSTPTTVHAILQVAADDEVALNDRVSEISATAAFQAGVTVLLRQEGRTRVDEPGHEHFGFKDGVSQPGLRGVNAPDDPLANPDQGHPGQDLLWPGEFILGYPTQIAKAAAGESGLNTHAGPVSKSGPAWTADGSYLVFRRLAQDVPAFTQQLQTLSAQTGLPVPLLGAKLVGRYKSGCPLEEREFHTASPAQSPVDPGVAAPALADSDTVNNHFEFGDDPAGAVCPLAAHIRKAYPRDERTQNKADDSESSTQTHRLLRRGIPFGRSFGAPQGGGANDPRGLLFFAYQKDIESQFEFVQSSWVNSAAFPPFPTGVTPGQDPIIAQSPIGSFQVDPTKPNISVRHFVTTTGGEYFFAPSISALQKLGANAI